MSELTTCCVVSSLLSVRLDAASLAPAHNAPPKASPLPMFAAVAPIAE